MISGPNRESKSPYKSGTMQTASCENNSENFLQSIRHGFPGSPAPALLHYATYAVRECVAALQRCVPFPTRVNCGSSRKGATHQSVLGHISGCRLQNCCSSHGSHNISGCRLQNCRITQLLLYWKLSRQGWPRPAGYSSIMTP